MKKSFKLFSDLLLALLISSAVLSCKIEPETKTETETKITSGTVSDGSKVQHFLQSVDTKTYVLQSGDTEEKNVKAGTLMAGIAKQYTGFTVKGLSQNDTTINIYYDRNTITYTFSSGEGKFLDGSTAKTSSGLYGSLVKISDPEKNGQYFSEWKDSDGKEMTNVFGAEDSSYTAHYTDSFVKFVKITGADVTKKIDKSDSAFYEASEQKPVKVGSFYIAETELTYKKWYRIYTWATDNERGDKIYKFANAGREGSNGTDGAVPAEGTEPVTNISWRDAIVWCNAASERFGLTPVYQTSEADITPIRISEDSNTSSGKGKAETAYENKSANGFRLPTEAEWEFAARGGDQTSAAWSYNYAGTDSSENLADYAVYNTEATANVKTKKPNSIGLYDMTGNVYEWCFDAAPSSSTNRIRRGGCYSNEIDSDDCLSVSYRSKKNAGNFVVETGGLRLVRNAE